MPAHGGVDVVEPREGGQDRPESPMTEKFGRTNQPRTDSPSTPRFLGQIGNVKTLRSGGGGLVRTEVGADGPGRSREDATEREPWRRVGTISDGDISHVTQVWLLLQGDPFFVRKRFFVFKVLSEA